MKELKIKKVFDVIQSDPYQPVGTVMREVGYSKSYSDHPKAFLNGQISKREYAERFPPELLEKVHKEGLDATTNKPHMIDRDLKGRPVYEYEPEPDYSTRHKYLDSAYKLKGSYSPEEVEHTILSPFIKDVQKNTDEKNKPQIKSTD